MIDISTAKVGDQFFYLSSLYGSREPVVFTLIRPDTIRKSDGTVISRLTGQMSWVLGNLYYSEDEIAIQRFKNDEKDILRDIKYWNRYISETDGMSENELSEYKDSIAEAQNEIQRLYKQNEHLIKKYPEEFI